MAAIYAAAMLIHCCHYYADIMPLLSFHFIYAAIAGGCHINISFTDVFFA